MTQRLLIIGPSNIGDAILMADVVAAVSRRHPTAHLTLVVGQRAKALFTDDPRVHTLMDINRFDFPLGRLQLALALWRYQPQVVVDLRHTLYPLLLKPLQSWRYLRRPPRTLIHMRDRALWRLRAQAPGILPPGFSKGWAGAVRESTDGASSLPCSPRDTAHVDALCKRWRLDPHHPLVLISGGARSHIKRWMADGFARVADRLIDELKAQVVFSGEPEEEPIVAEILERMTHPAHSVVGLTTIRQLAGLMQRAQLVIANDSAALHLASAVRVPTVAIFGPTDEGKYGPTAPQHRTLRRRLFCAPCEQALCRFQHECMRFIAPDDVFSAAHDLLVHGARPRARGRGRRA